MEHRIYLSDYTWTEDDYIPGQIKFIMSTPEKLGKASVRLYLNDGYTAPEEVEEAEVDTKSENYCAMIEKSLMNLGNTYRIRKAIEKAKAGKDVTVAYSAARSHRERERHRSIRNATRTNPISCFRIVLLLGIM